MAKVENVFDGYAVTLGIPAQHFTAAHKTAIKEAYGGKGSVTLQQHCAVAEATNEAFGAVYAPDREKLEDRGVLDFGDLGRFMLNKKARARFGINHQNQIFLTVGLIEEVEDDTAAKYRLTWKGDAIPETLARIAVAHDEGETHQEVEIELPLGDAQLVAVSKSVDKRPYTKERKAAKNGGTRSRPRKHRRICATDIERTYASQN